MLGNIVTFIASRLASRTMDAVERKLVWSAIGSFLFAAAAVFGLLFAFWILQSVYGSRAAAGILALACIALGFAGFWMPSAIDWAERRMEGDDDTSQLEAVAETVDEEAHAAVDYLGPLQAIASAFMVGVMAGRSIRGSRTPS